jgi:hypothetical protein
MTDAPSWLATLLQWGIWFVLVSLVLGWLSRDRLQAPQPTTTGTLLKLPLSLLVVGVICAAMFGAFTVLSYSAPTGGPVIATVFLLFASLGGYVIYEYFRDRYELRRDGIAYRTPLGGERFAPWADVLWVRYSRTGNWIVLKLLNGRNLRLSVMLIGLPAFAEALLRNVNPDLIAEDSRQVIEETARGEPPKVWM